MTTRLMLKGTKFVEEPLKNLKCELGIFLDIYPYDNIPDSDEELKKQAKRAWFWSKVLILRHVAFPVLPYKGFKASLHMQLRGLSMQEWLCSEYLINGLQENVLR